MKGLIYSLIAAALLASCAPPMTPASTEEPAPTSQPGPTSEPASPEPVSESQPIRADVPRIASPQVAEGQEMELVRGNNSFALDLYHAVVEGNADNLIYSPYSISLALSMVYAGARGETEAQMAEVFHYLPQEAQHPAFNLLDQRLARLGEKAAGGESEGDPFQLNIANAIWGQQGFPFKQAYLETLAGQYGAGLQAADFAQQPEEARQAINAWVADQTEERIKDLAPPGVITPDTRLVLVNAIYFKGAWLFPFDEAATQDAPFTLLDGSQVTVPMMQRQTARVPYTEGNGYHAVQLPSTGEAVDMLIILPEQGSFAAVEEELSADFFDEVRQRAELRDVVFKMPRLDFETALELSDLLQTLGMTDAFAGDADFSGMVEGGGLFISAALHRANITVDEKGTEAAAATLVAMAESALEQVTLTIDRPFMFAIVERETGTILFLGRVMNPVAGG